MKKSKIWGICFILLIILSLLFFAGITIVIDPFFHYHAPISKLNYPINNQRYQNDGIVKNFEYDAIITGTSMTENFKTTECDKLFNVKSIKVPFAGASYYEINNNLKVAFSANSDIKLVIRALDGDRLREDKDLLSYDSYPTYLTDENIFNDVKYLLNKNILINYSLGVLNYTKAGKNTTTFDEYSNWSNNTKYGKDVILSKYVRPKKNDIVLEFNEQNKQEIYDNINQNVIELAKQNPDTQFYYFFPPYSIYYWDALNQKGIIKLDLDSYKYATQLMLEQENIHLFAFFEEYELIVSCKEHKDRFHYSEKINTKILEWMANDQYRLTKENYEEYWNKISEIYLNVDYDSLF